MNYIFISKVTKISTIIYKYMFLNIIFNNLIYGNWKYYLLSETWQNIKGFSI